MAKMTVTERTFYPSLIQVIQRAGGAGVQEVQFNSVPDILFEIENHKWILSVKIGQDMKTVKDAFLQYLRHKEESRIQFGIVLFLPESLRAMAPLENAVDLAVGTTIVQVLIDTPIVKEQIGDKTFPGIVDFLLFVVTPKLQRQEKKYYSLHFVISLLQLQVEEMMRDISLSEDTILHIITNRDLLMDLGHLDNSNSEAVAHFLASFILMSQILFLRLLYSANPAIFSNAVITASHHSLRDAFKRVLQINYRPIFSLDVLDSIPEKFLKDTFDLIWGLQIENVRYELPGRIFHELMPKDIRKMLAAFYTRPQAADILADLTITQSSQSVLDPSCGSGTILTSAYRRKSTLFGLEGKAGNPHKRFCEDEIFGADIMPFAVHLTSANIAAMDVNTAIERTQIIQGDSLKLGPDKVFQSGLAQLGLFSETPAAQDVKGNSYQVRMKQMEVQNSSIQAVSSKPTGR